MHKLTIKLIIFVIMSFFKIVVIIIICILALLFIYMGFLLCLDPLMNKRVRSYQEQRNEELSMVNKTYKRTTVKIN